MSSTLEEQETVSHITNASNANLIGVQNGSATGLPPVIGRIERNETMPVCIIFVGMAGSGKSSLVTQLQSSLDQKFAEQDQQLLLQQQQQQDQDTATDTTTDAELPKVPYAYCVNLDPATLQVAYDASIDIRDTIHYKQVMQQHKLGPNGAILTSLNLFATKFDQVMNILERRAYGSSTGSTEATTVPQHQGDVTDGAGESKSDDQNDNEDEDDDEAIDYILVDTPGQIEAFTWSASGSMISEALASAFPTILCFVIDTPRCAASPNTFMSNMLYACSMLYRTKLPLVICFNKIDVVSHEFCMEWMRDNESFQQALDDTAETSGFYGSLTRSLSLVLEEFYTNFGNACGVSAYTGDGIDEFWTTVQKAARQDFCMDYIDDLKNRIEEQQVRRQALARISANRIQRDLERTHIHGDDEEDDEE
jgi:GPN-loop GTPase